MIKYRNHFKKYINDLAAKKPSPGGGSVAALTFCLGVSLIEKALRYSAINRDSFDLPLKRFKILRAGAFRFIDLDGDLFEKVMRAKGKNRALYLKKSERIVTMTADYCRKAIALAKRVEPGIKKGIISDFHIGRELVSLSLNGCILNIQANASMFKKKQ
jgi:formiminotetrahydrofolate cyclodeaminase